MNKNTFQVIFEGQLTGEYAEQHVKKNLSALFKMNAEQIDTLFASKGVVIKRNIDEQVAQKYAGAMKKAGANCRIVAESAETTVSTTTTQENTEATPSSATTPVMTTRDVVNLKVPTDLSSISMAQAGEILLTAQAEIEPNIPDISELQLATNDAPLVPPSQIAEPNIEISGLSVKPIDD